MEFIRFPQACGREIAIRIDRIIVVAKQDDGTCSVYVDGLDQPIYIPGDYWDILKHHRFFEEGKLVTEQVYK